MEVDSYRCVEHLHSAITNHTPQATAMGQTHSTARAGQKSQSKERKQVCATAADSAASSPYPESPPSPHSPADARAALSHSPHTAASHSSHSGHAHGHGHSAHGGLSVAAVRRRYVLGLVLLLIVVLLWVGSSALIQSIFVDRGFHAPFFLTYYSTSLFTLYLPFYYGRQWVAKRGWTVAAMGRFLCGCCRSQKARMRETATLLRDPHQTSTHTGEDADMEGASHRLSSGSQASSQSSTRNGSLSGLDVPPSVATAATLSSSDSHSSSDLSVDSTDALLQSSEHSSAPTAPSSSDSFDTHQIASPRIVDVEAANGSGGHHSLDPASPDAAAPATEGVPFTLRQHIVLAAWLSPVWFCMNFFFNVSLQLTSISSSTILATTSSLFVLLFTRILDPATPILPRQVLGVAATIAGATIISWKDGGSEDATPEFSHKILGDLLAAASAIFYGLYSVSLRLRCPADDSLFSMELVFGFLGLLNLLLMWPGFFVLDGLGIEEFRGVPPGDVMGFLTINGLLGTVVSDFLWARSVLLTSPLIASLGLALTIPLAVLFDLVFHSLRFSVSYLLGGLCVLAGFALVNLVHSQELKEEAIMEQQEQMQQQQEEHQQQEVEEGHSKQPHSHSPTLPSVSLQPNGHLDALEDVDLEPL